jgi:hypothetical protein
MRVLFGVDAPAEKFGPHGLAADFNLKPIRKAVAELIASLA